MLKNALLKSSLIIASAGIMTFSLLPLSTVKAASKPVLTYATHMQQKGWMAFQNASDKAENSTNRLKDPATFAGITGKGLRVEALKINLTGVGNDVSIKYNVHNQTYGWSGWVDNGQVAGKTGKGKRAEAVSICVTGLEKYGYELKYRVHVQGIGWLDWVSAENETTELTNEVGINSGYAGTVGYGKRVEAIEIALVSLSSSSDELSQSEALNIAKNTYETAYDMFLDDNVAVYGNYNVENETKECYKINLKKLESVFSEKAINDFKNQLIEYNGEYYDIDNSFMQAIEVATIFSSTDSGMRPLNIVAYNNNCIVATGKLSKNDLIPGDDYPLYIVFVKENGTWKVETFE